jgi:hypothetical protein
MAAGLVVAEKAAVPANASAAARKSWLKPALIINLPRLSQRIEGKIAGMAGKVEEKSELSSARCRQFQVSRRAGRIEFDYVICCAIIDEPCVKISQGQVLISPPIG